MRNLDDILRTATPRNQIFMRAYVEGADGVHRLNLQKLLEGHKAAGYEYDATRDAAYLAAIDQSAGAAGIALKAYFADLARYVVAAGNTIDAFVVSIHGAVLNGFLDSAMATAIVTYATEHPGTIHHIVTHLTDGNTAARSTGASGGERAEGSENESREPVASGRAADSNCRSGQQDERCNQV